MIIKLAYTKRDNRWIITYRDHNEHLFTACQSTLGPCTGEALQFKSKRAAQSFATSTGGYMNQPPVVAWHCPGQQTITGCII